MSFVKHLVAFASLSIFCGACAVKVGQSTDSSKPSGQNPNSVAQAQSPNTTKPFSNVRLLGRVDPNAPIFTWPGSGLSFTFVGTQASVTFSQVTGNVSLYLAVDNNTPTILPQVTANTPISTGVKPMGTHTVTVYKRSESALGTLTLGSVVADGKITPTSAAARRIEFIGGSMTVGYGADGNSPCVNTAALEDAPNAYGSLTAKTLNADFSLVAWSGKGLVRNAPKSPADTTPTMPEIWTHYSALDAADSYPFETFPIPQVVVINLGTNDFAYLLYDAQGNASTAREPLNIDSYIQGYLSFIKKIRTKYPDAFIFMTTTSMLSDTYPTAGDAQHTTQLNALNTVVKQASDSKLQVVDFPAHKVGSGLNGCDSHPNLAEHKALAAILAPVIKTAMAW